MLNKNIGVFMEIILLLILAVLALIAVQLSRITTLLSRSASAGETAIQCLDAHESLLKSANEENRHQGIAIEDIKRLLADKS